ncbi:TPA: hypothetical protein NBO33_004831 [Enterobacter hormaechei]|uniref:hypothetical protein n=1 Tax=Enterobacter hormaechei TaxID=158836 RepID=UPI000796E700|nr:hypothetical protein [Enterobacter hormaechei]HCM9116189.1 hypothetical protein [Enterobacter hormaechei subsp. steigerwaltii]MBD8853976.1 hypothetical protein [Enterobacter hormaechei]CZU17134.1 Uncharacterised protein [Enterobacter hormaechei]SAC84709.1 Uncharacterised protein [Enterobacter hormaechei]SAH70685.1 Uncharacterised protein [Enterobacter hormaechei]
MSNIDKRALREELSNPAIGSNAHLRKLALALLDELESKDNRINRLEAIVAVAEQRNALMREWKRALKVPCDLVDDQVPVVIHGMVIRLERLKETEAKLEAAEKRIADLEAREVRLPELCVGVVQGGHAVMVPYAAGHWFNKTAILEMLTDAGINIAAAGKGE